jgi:predicted polyphosphate/ATP-dependent NAD kinase
MYSRNYYESHVKAVSGLKQIGLIVNPVAGLGGRVGLKGSDGAETQLRARTLGAESPSPSRTVEALRALKGLAFTLYTYPGDMGENEARDAGLKAVTVGELVGESGPQDTVDAARLLRDRGVELILFSGGDGTARDILRAIDADVPVLGIPSGVKIHSAVFAVSPKAAGFLAAGYIRGEDTEFRDAEVMDVDEEAFRRNVLSARLYGYMRTLFKRDLTQRSKEVGPSNDELDAEAVAAEIVSEMDTDTVYIIGPGTTTKKIMDQLGLEKTLLGVDLVKGGKLLALDVNEDKIIEIIDDGRAKVIVSVIGGQGFILGRGNQQISPKVIRKVGKDNIIVAATPGKLAALRGSPLKVDTGDPELDKELQGFKRVVTGFGRNTICRVT